MLLHAAWTIFLLLPVLSTAQDAPCTTRNPADGKFYDLTSISANKDYYVKSFGGHEFYINVCRAVRTETWNLDNPDKVGGFMRVDRGDFSIGQVNTTLQMRDGHPLLVLMDGSTCPGGGNLRASTAIRFICDRSVFSAGEPQLIAELPIQDERACAFFIEWRTHVACPASEPGGFVGFLVVAVMIVIGGIMVLLIASVAYNRFVRHQRGFSQLPHMPFSSAVENIFDFFHDTCDRMGFTRDRWARDQSWQGFSSRDRNGRGFERLPRSGEEAQSMLAEGDSDNEIEETQTRRPAVEMDDQDVHM